MSNLPLILAVVVALAAGGYIVYQSKWFRSKLRNIEWGDAFISLWPNLGFQIGKYHWCKAKGWHAGFRPRNLGLQPGVLAEEGTELYKKRMAYVFGPQWAQDPNYRKR